MNYDTHVGSKTASCFYYQTMQIHKLRVHLLFVKGLRIISLQIYEAYSIYDIQQVLVIDW